MYFSPYKRDMLRRFVLILCTCLVFGIWLYEAAWSGRPICRGEGLLSIVPWCESWNLFYHLGGNGPWIPRDSTVSQQDDVLPAGCRVDQVHMMCRHAERYPTKKAGARHLALLARLHSPTVRLTGPLNFLKTWTYFTDTTSPEFEALTRNGPYAGTTEAHNTGVKLRHRYHHLVNSSKTTNFWTCSSPRDIETAQYFGNGFFGEHWEENKQAQLHIIPEEEHRGGDTLTPGDTCLEYRKDKVYGHDYGYSKLAKWQDAFAGPIADRLSPHAGGIQFTSLEVYGMMEVCGFEILARGSSPWCDVFTRQEWLHFEYARDLLHFYRAGPGNKYAGAMGWLWLNASQEIMSNASASGVYFSFVHDGDIIPLMATLGLLDERSKTQYLPTDRVKEDRQWKTSDVVPMGGRVIFERVSCGSDGPAHGARRHYIRAFINDGLVDLDMSTEARNLPGSMSLEDWQRFVRERGATFGSFQDVCGLPGDAPSKITFLHQ